MPVVFVLEETSSSRDYTFNTEFLLTISTNSKQIQKGESNGKIVFPVSDFTCQKVLK